jgi:hypothetical protein
VTHISTELEKTPSKMHLNHLDVGKKYNMNFFQFVRGRAQIFRIAVVIVAGIVWSIPASCQDMYQAIVGGNLEKVRALLKDNPTLVYSTDEIGDTPLHWAAEFGAESIAAFLVSEKADVNASDSLGYTPLHWTVQTGHTDIARLLLASKANVNVNDRNGWTALHWAVHTGNKEIALLLLANGANVNAKNNYGESPLDYASSADSTTNSVAWLLRRHGGLDRNGRDVQYTGSISNDNALTQYHNDKGFRLLYPVEWKIATKEKLGDINDIMRKFLQNIDFDRLTVAIYNPDSNPVQNFNIVVVAGPIPITEDVLPELKREISQMYSSLGIKLANQEAGLISAGKKRAILLSYTSSGAVFGDLKMVQQQYIIPGKYHTYIITCSGGVASYARIEPVFAKMINSFQIEGEPDGSH